MKVKSVEFHTLVSLVLLTVTVLGQSEQKSSSEISWTISKSSVTCGRTEEDKSGCLCQSQLVGSDNKPHNYITCTCGEETQTVHLRGSRRTIETEHVTWRIQNCPNVTIHSHILPRLDGVNFNLILANISNLQLLEGAFQSDSTSSSPLDKSVTFDSVNLATIPARSFPSNLARIQFNNSVIGTIQSGAFKQLYITSMVFENTRVDNMEPNAFYQDLSSWVASNSHFNRLQSACITGGIRQMNWTDSVIQHMESNSLTALIGHSVFARMSFGHVEPHGLTINQWSTLAFINNTFGWVNTSAIDLTQRSSEAQPALLDSNVWHDPEPNFITVGSSSTEDIVHVENNTFVDLCECGKTFSPLVTTEGSKQWFVKALLKASRCPISPRASFCLSLNTSAYLNFDQLDLLCEHYACTKELGLEGQAFNPQTLPDRLRLIAIFLGILAGAIVLSLLITMCVYLIRRRRPSSKAKMSRNFGVQQEMSRNFSPHISKGFGPQEMSQNFGPGITRTLAAQEMSRNFGAEVSRNFGAEVSRNFGAEVSRNFGGEVSRNFGAEVSRNLDPKNFGSEMSRNFDPVSRNFDPMSRNLAPTLRPRSTLLEDVEMEDKGVQTMPSELSTDVLEGLREKLSKPDSFWDAKETIDHLYGLIQVQSAGGGNNINVSSNNNGNQLSSPPDVTMTNGTGKIGAMVKSASTIPIIPITCGNAYSISPLPTVPTQQAPAGRYAQIRSKPKTFYPTTTTPTTTTMLCEYRDPSDSPVHIYSELDNPNLRSWKNSSRPVPPRITLPILSEYNEPKDVQMNVYAELTNCANNQEQQQQQQDQQVPTMRTFSTLQRPLPDIPTSSSVPILKNSTPL